MKVLEEFMVIVQNESFVEGHEVLEELWRDWKNTPKLREESYILKGLINGSTALALMRLERFVGAKKVWETFEKYALLIDTLPSSHTPLYQKARDILYVKRLELLNKKESL